MSHDIAVLCCIPLEESEWLERFTSRGYGDFVRSNVEEKFKGDLHQTWRVFSHEAIFIRRKLEALADEGADIVLRAESSHIREAAAKHENVVIVAHWKHERILRSDIWSAELLRRQIVDVDPSLRVVLSAGERLQLAETLCRVLNDLIVHGGSRLVAVPAELGDGRLPASVLRREVLNTMPYLAPGNRLETWDSMVSAEQFSKLFGKEFKGTALMAICNSTLLAETFRTHHSNAICICNRETANAGLNLAKFHAAVMIMQAKRLPLWRALNQVGDIIDSVAT